MYPVTIIKTRYQGTYEGGRWGAFPVDFLDVPMDTMGDDIETMTWWSQNKDYVGVGETPEAALEDLEKKMENPEYAEFAPGIFRTRWGAWIK